MGQALVDFFKLKKGLEIVKSDSSIVNFTDWYQTQDFINKHNPDTIIIAAAKVGGILYNQNNSEIILKSNLSIQNHILSAAAEIHIPNLIFLGSSCVYPKFCPQPIKEEYLLTGSLEKTNEAYAISKIAGIKMTEYYKNKLDLNWFSVMPCNLYGENDNFDISNSHVLPGMINKFHFAKTHKQKKVELWGSGSAKREFMHVSDLAPALDVLLDIVPQNSLINVGSGEEITINQLASLISEVIGFNGQIDWNSEYPEGTPRKILDSEYIRSNNWEPKVRLRQGIEKVYDYFLRNNVRGKN